MKPRHTLLLFCLLFILWMLSPQTVAAQGEQPTPSTTPAATLIALPTLTPTPAPFGIFAPTEGQPVHGVVNILGTSASDGFQSFNVAFEDDSSATSTWFPLSSSNQPVTSGVLAVWDTTSITDGDYRIRLQAVLAEGTREATITVRVRNYSPLNTPTPTATVTLTPTPTATPLPTATLTITPTEFPTLPVLPTNPAVLNLTGIQSNLGKGALVVLIVFAFFGLILYLRHR